MEVPKYLRNVRELLNTASSFGVKTLSNGTELIGLLPHIAPEARLHILFPGLKPSQIRYMEEQLKVTLPAAMHEFFSFHNGISLFSGSLTVYGLRKDYSRTGDNAWQPFDILVANLYEAPENFESNNVIIGGYKEDGSKLYVDSLSNEVCRCSQNNQKPLNQWPSFDSMLLKETERLSTVFDSTGKLIKRQKTVPTAQKNVKS